MKLSRYNFLVKNRNGDVYFFNALTGALARIKEENKALIEKMHSQGEGAIINIEEFPADLREGLKKGGYVIDRNLNEIEYIRFLENLSRFSSHSFGLTLVVTMKCNFHCFYCYEDSASKSMDDEVLKKNPCLSKKFGSTV